MMKRILSVVLSVIMMLSLIAVPGLAADLEPAAVEYTVSSVTYSAKAVPPSGTFTASVDVTASAPSQASVIYATLQDGAMLSAKYVTKTVGASKETFTETFVANPAYTYKVFVVETATGKALAPEANFPVHENALAFVEVEYVNGTSEKLPVAEDDEIITILKTPESRVAGNPKFKFIPLDNSSKIEEEGGRNFWEENKKVTLTAADGSEKKVYTVEPDTIKLTFKPTVADDYLYENLGGKVQYNPVVEKITAIITGSEVTVDVPAGTSSVALQSFTHGDVKVNGATINFTGATAKHTFKINGKTYTVNLRWDENTPGIYNVTRNFAKTNRSFFLRANGKALYVQHGLQDAEMKNAAAAVAVSTGEKLADDGSAFMNITIPLDTDGDAATPLEDTPLRNDASTLAIVTTNSETGNREYSTSSISSLMGSWIKGNTSGEWVKFTPSAAGTVYVRATQADAMTEDYTWNEITNEDGSLKDGWYEVVGAKLNGKTEDFKMFAKNFEADEEVVIPTQALDGDEYRYVKTTLMSGTEYSLESYTEGSLPQLYKNGSPVEGHYFCRRKDMFSKNLKTGYDAFALICFDVELAENYNPALSGADKLDLWYSTAAKIEEPATQSATAANVQSGNSVYTGGIYQVPAKAAKEATVNHTDKTFEITVPYGTEKVTLDIRDGAGQSFANKDYYPIQYANGKITGVKVVDDSEHLLYAYTGTIKWADFDAEEMSETAPLVYELAYKVSGKENLVGDDNYYYVMPTRLTLNEAADLVEGTSDLKGDDGIVDLEAGEWFTSQSHNRGNYVALDAGKHYNNLHISGKSFASWVENDTLTDKYALDGATMLVTDYKDTAQDTRFEFKTVKSGYVIAAYATEQSLEGWTHLEGCKIETTRGATTEEKESLSWPPAGHTNQATDFALWADSYDYIYVKKVVENEAVTINETATTQNLPPIVMVTDKEIFPTPSMKTISYKVGDGEATPITFAEGVKTANITVAYTTEAVSVVGEINGTGKAVADKSVTLDYATPSDVITVAIQDVFGETVDTYTINITMDFATAQAPALETLTYTIGNGTPVALEFDGVTEINVPVVSYTPDTFYIDATITGNGFVEISDEEFVIEYEDAPNKIETKAVTVIVKNVENETVATYTLNFAMDFNTLVNPTFSKIFYKIGDGEPVEIESLTENAATVRFETLISDAVSLVAENEGDGYWVYGDPITLDENNISGEVTATLKNAIHDVIATYTITFTIPEKPAISVKFTPVLNNYLAFSDQTATKKRKTYTEQEVSFEEGPQEYIVTVPYGTESVTVAPIETALGTVEGFTLDFEGEDSAETSFEIGGFTYDVTFKWEHDKPYIYNVSYHGVFPERYIVLRGSDNGYIGYSTSISSSISGTTTEVLVDQPLAKAEDSNLSLTVNDKAISKAYSTVFTLSRFDNFVNAGALANLKNPGKVGWNQTENWISFKASDAGTVYVQMSHANANEPGFEWEEAKGKGWTKQTNVTAGTDSAIYSLRFNAGDTVNIPSQVVTQAEINYVNAKLQEAYPTSGTYQFMYKLVNGDGYAAQLHYSNDKIAYNDPGKTWTAIPAGTKLSDGITLDGTLYMGAYYRCANNTGLLIDPYGYKTFVVVAFDEPVDESAPARLNDLEDGGLVAAVEADSVNTTQETGSTDITVSGSDANYKNEVVAVYVLADGKSMSDLTAELAGGSSDDLVEEGIILAMGKAWADDDGNFTVDLTLPEGAGTDDYNVGIVTEEATEAPIEYVGIADQITAYNAIVDAANDSGSIETAFANIAYIINTNDIYNSLDVDDKEVIQASVKADEAVKALPVINAGSYTESDIANIAKLAEIIDTRVAIEVFNNGDSTQFDMLKGYILNDASLTNYALAIFEGVAINAKGKSKVLEAITSKNFEVTAGATIQQKVSAAFNEAVFVNLINNTTYTNLNSVLPSVENFDNAGVLVGTNGVAMNDVTLAALSEIMKGTDITGYTDFADRVNVLTAPAGEQEPPAPGGPTGDITNDNRPSPEGGGGGGISYPLGPTTKLLSSFVDANDAPWAATALQTMLDRNILSGYGDNTIRPNNSATRQEVAKMLVEAFSAVRPYAWTGFSDVPAGSWYYSYVATAAEDGIIKGMGDGRFGTDANITREDLSVLIYRFLVNKGIAMNGVSMRAFTDAANMSNYATEAIHALTNAGIVNGYTDGSYNPKGNATRAEIAQIIANVIVIYAL